MLPDLLTAITALRFSKVTGITALVRSSFSLVPQIQVVTSESSELISLSTLHQSSGPSLIYGQATACWTLGWVLGHEVTTTRSLPSRSAVQWGSQAKPPARTTVQTHRCQAGLPGPALGSAATVLILSLHTPSPALANATRPHIHRTGHPGAV